MYEKIKAILDQQDRTFAWLSRQTGISKGAFGMMKKRGNNLRIDNLRLVAKALNKPLKDFL